MSRIRLLVGLSLCLSIAACSTDETGDPLAPDASVPECTEGARRCAEDIVESCDDGDWTPVGLCTGGEVCQGGACVDAPCTPDCAGASCGMDGCGDTCGRCDADEVCVDRRCAAPGGCGDGTCGGGEDCATCPADCGRCCGDGVCGADEDCATCPADCGCADGQRCDTDGRTCVEACAPIDCTAVECGANGCGGSCGTCAGDAVCESGACVPAGPLCGDATCDPAEGCATCPADCGACCGDGVCDADVFEDCASCPADCRCEGDSRCDVDARACVDRCMPSCDGRVCGPDGCGGACGVCAGGEVCDADGVCGDAPVACGDGICRDGEDCQTCPADCGACCGDEICAPFESCATCPVDCGCDAESRCDAMAQACVPIVCEADCGARVCGPDGCGGACGDCDDGALCDVEAGVCRLLCIPRCDEATCGDDGCGGNCGVCPDDEVCVDGACQPPCEPVCDGRVCGPDGCGGVCGDCGAAQACTLDGQCVGGGLGCDCPGDEQCVAGVCRLAEHVCSPGVADGFCPNGQVCLAGGCEDAGDGCSPQSPVGVCPVGALCLGGGCRAFDARTVCDDGSPCTADVYDPTRDGCRRAPQQVACDDGDGCTEDACIEGICQGDAIVACQPGPIVDPYPSATREARIVLTGSRADDASLLVDGDEASPPGDDRWAVTLDLSDGENTFSLQTLTGGVESAERVIRIVRDDDPPSTRITPGGGMYRDGVTVTIAATEPGDVYFTTDGSLPTEWSPRIDGVRTLRVFDDTIITARARDRAGNWQAEPRVESYEVSGSGSDWRVGPALPEGRDGLAATSDGRRIFIAGGADEEGERNEAFVYEPARQAWLALPPTLRARSEAALVWHDGVMFLIGGRAGEAPLSDVERYRPDGEGVWVGSRAMPSTRYGLQALSIAGEIHVFGGQTNGGAVLALHQIYDPRTDTWREAPQPMPRPRYGFSALRAPTGLIYMVGGQDEDGRPIGEVDVLDPASGVWARAPDVPTPRSKAAVVLTENRGAVRGGTVGLVMAGGRTADGQPSARVEELVFDDDRWRPRRPLRRPRVAAASATVEGNAPADLTDSRVMQGWLLGGQVFEPGALDAPATRSRTTAFFTRDQDHVRRLPELPAGRSGHAVASLDDLIYVVGGRGLVETTAGWSYDPETGTSRDIADLPSSRLGLAAVALDGRVWAIGGENRFGVPQASLYSYDPAADAWTAHRPMLNARRDAVAVVFGREIAVVGGDNNGPVQTVEFYDPATDRWRNGPLLPAPRADAAGVSWAGRIFVAGGIDDEGAIHPDVLVLDDEGWQTVREDGFGLVGASAAVVNGRMIVFGGRGAAGENSNRRRIIDLATDDFTPHFTLEPPTRLLAPYAEAAAVSHNGDVYLFGGSASGRPGGLAAVQRYDGRCLDGRFGLGEGRGPYVPFPDLGGGCGDASPTAALEAATGYGHHGSCNGWNDCGDGQTCADLACAWFGFAEAFSFRETRCLALASGNCDLFRGLGDELDVDFDGAACNVSVVFQVVCLVE